VHRVLLTGATGFVGGNVARQFVTQGIDVLCTVRRAPGESFPFPWRVTDLGDETDIASALREHEATAVVHLAIDGAFELLARQRRAAYDGYVGMTRRVVDAANATGTRVALVSTDWVFDGTGHLVDEDEPVMPVNTYGMLKALSEQVVLDRADNGFVARVAGVQAIHMTRKELAWTQNCGFGNLALAVVSALRAGERFEVWEGAGTNAVATPVSAREIGRLLAVALRSRADGILHIAGGDAVGRLELAELTCGVFGLDSGLLSTRTAPEGNRFSEPVPYDTSLASTRTDEVLGVRPAGILDQLRSLRADVNT
jgi:dTDP-4-dehydrorhamnose reductase